MGLAIFCILASAYMNTHGPYLNMIDVSLITTAVLFILVPILALIFSGNDKDDKK